MYFWQTECIRLRAVEPSDWEIHHAWDQDSEMQRRLEYIRFPRSKEASKEWAQKKATAQVEHDQMFFQIEDLEGEHLGMISMHNTNQLAGTFSYGIAIRAQHQRKGYASDAIRLVLRYFFQELRYQKVWIAAASFNEASIKLHERVGFQLEGRLRRMVYTNGQYFDEMIYGMTKEEFETKYPSAKSPFA